MSLNLEKEIWILVYLDKDRNKMMNKGNTILLKNVMKLIV